MSYTEYNFSHHLPTNCVASSQAAIVELMDFMELMDFTDFTKLVNFTEFAKLTEKDRTYRKVWTHGKRVQLTEKRVSAPWPTPIHKPSMTSMVWNISIDQLGLAAWLCSLPAPAHLLISQTQETEETPWFLSSNWKHQYCQHSSLTKSKTQKVLGGKLTPSQPKPGWTVINSRSASLVLLVHVN